MSYKFNPFSGNLDEVGTPIDTNQFALSAHAANHVAGTKAQLIVFGGETGGIDTTVFFRADNAGTAGNSIALAFDGVDDIDTVVGAWNSANPSNTVATAGDVSQVPDDETSLQLANGVNGGSDSLNQINQNLNTEDDVSFNTFNTETFGEGSFTQIGNFYAPANTTEGNNTFFRIGTEDNGDKAAQIGYRAGGDGFGRNGFICLDFYGMDYLFQLSHDGGKPELWTGETPTKLLTLGDGLGTGEIVSELDISIRDNESEDGPYTATFVAQGNLTDDRTYDLPDASGTLALVGDFASAPIRGQCSKTTSGTISGLVAGTYKTTALSATFDSGIASGTSLGTTDHFAIKNTSGATRIVRVYASMDATAGNNQLLGIKLAKNGTPINETECRSQTGSNNFAKLVTSWIVSLANNDEIALFVANINNTTNIAFQRGRIIVSSVD